jgi:hypothetical protein
MISNYDPGSARNEYAQRQTVQAMAREVAAGADNAPFLAYEVVA